MAKSKKKKHSAFRVANRRRAVAREFLAGSTLRDIAEKYNVSKSTVSKDIDSVKERWVEMNVSDLDSWIKRELLKLEEIEKAAWDGEALNILLDVLHRRAKLLGLDAPERKHFTGESIVGVVQLTDEQLAAIAAGSGQRAIEEKTRED